MEKSELKALIKECHKEIINESYPKAYGDLLKASNLVWKAYRTHSSEYGKDEIFKQIEQIDKLLKKVTLAMTKKGMK
jgi:flavodoxin